ncbi:E3 ubiquitin-protein ligase Hakai, partial [Galemys pyrenaicus]
EHYDQPHEDIHAPPTELSMTPPPLLLVSQETFHISTTAKKTMQFSKCPCSMPPYKNRFLLEPPPCKHGGLPVTAPYPHHYNLNSLPKFTEDQGSLGLLFTQPGGMSLDI